MQPPTCLCCKKAIQGVAINYYGKDSCLKCYNAFKNSAKSYKQRNNAQLI